MISVCIPTLNRYDLCINLLSSLENGTLKPDKYYIMDNGGEFNIYYKNSKLLLNNLTIIDLGKNLGVSKSWNWFLENIKGDILIVNDDIEFSQDALRSFIEMKNNHNDPNTVIYTLVIEEVEPKYPNFSLFMLNTDIKTKVGFFDENFSPAYFEDNDYIYRTKLLGYNIKMFSVSNYYTHGHSATLKRLKEQGLHESYEYWFNRNKQYYISKWGGEPYNEKYIIPFNKGEVNV